jgi:chitinase
MATDIDWEYPGGNGQDYMQFPNSEKVWEIDAFPLFLEAIKSTIGDDVELSIAAPGRVEDMIAYTAENVAQINNVVDYVNVSPRSRCIGLEMHSLETARKLTCYRS